MRRVPADVHRLRQRVLESLVPVDPDALVLVACSGGPDSLALALVGASLERRVGAIVVDHGLQRGSAGIAARAAAQCRELGLQPVRIESVSVPGPGSEAAARSSRYEALTRVAREEGAAAVLLGHTREDQAETVLLGLARGSGTRSLAGMAAARGIFVRPFLDEARARVRAVLEPAVPDRTAWGHDDLVHDEPPGAHSTGDLRPWQDPHNTDDRYARVRVRQHVLPVLEEQLGPGVIAALARTAALARDDADALDDIAREAAVGLGEGPWDVSQLQTLPTAVRMRVLRQATLAAGAPATDLTSDQVRAIDTLITNWHGQGPLTLPGRVRVLRRCGTLVFGSESRNDGACHGS